ncbi:SWIM zinc finger family protein [Solibacillus sp. FSL H8-0538]|uniref:SWIM zinc finger family protein n=1 Tax=Solibacillus sp. FSL H8-0538 TaxID=2921400 RepID=UPI0030F63FAD
MDLHNFEQYISKTFISRGKNYFKQGNVRQLHQIASNAWRAVVAGSDDYQVFVELKGTEINEFFCTCPFDGPTCKHEVAVFIAIRNQLDTVILPNFSVSLLQGLSNEQLLQVIEKLVEQNPFLHNQVQQMLTPKNKKAVISTVQQANKMILSYLQPYLDLENIFEEEFDEAFHGVSIVIDWARDSLITNQQGQALSLFLNCYYFAALTTELCNDWQIDELMSDIYLMMVEVVEEVEDEQMAMNFLKFFEETIFKDNIDKSKILKSDLFDVALPLTVYEKCAAYYKLMLTRLATYPNTEDLVETLSLTLTLEIGSPEEQQVYYERTDLNDSMRSLLITHAMDKQQYEQALALCADGIERTSSNTYKKQTWMENAYKIHDNLNNPIAKRAIAFELAVKGNESYYRELKGLYDTEEWAVILEQLLHSYEEMNHYPYFYSSILVEEHLWSQLLSYCHQQPERIVKFGQFLQPFYVQEVEGLFMAHIFDLAETSSNRSHYKTIRAALSSLKALGYEESTSQLIQTFTTRYPRRTALHDELAHI